MTSESASEQDPGWASLGFAFVAGLLLIFPGLIIAVYGMSALIFGGFPSGIQSAAGISAEAWSIIFAVGGVALFLAGCNLFVGQYWARYVGIAVAAVALVCGLISLGTYPVFASILICLNLGIIWSLGFRWNDMRSAI